MASVTNIPFSAIIITWIWMTHSVVGCRHYVCGWCPTRSVRWSCANMNMWWSVWPGPQSLPPRPSQRLPTLTWVTCVVSVVFLCFSWLGLAGLGCPGDVNFVFSICESLCTCVSFVYLCMSDWLCAAVYVNKCLFIYCDVQFNACIVVRCRYVMSLFVHL